MDAKSVTYGERLVIKNIHAYVDELIDSQEGLELEHGDLPFPAWNQGYREALLDVKNFIEQEEEIMDYDLENSQHEDGE